MRVMELGGLIPVLALVLGWALNEFSSSLRIRREDRRAAGPLLTDLLEMRHRLFGLDAAIAELRAHLPIPPEAEPFLKQLILQLIPEAPKYEERFEDAVREVARGNPILAFRLRGQPFVLPMLSQLRGIAAPDQAASLVWHRIVEPGFLDLLKPNLEDLILEVAKAHGWWTWFRAWRRLKTPLELTPSEKDRVSAFVAILRTGPPKGPAEPPRDSVKASGAGLKRTGSLPNEGEAQQG
jgi:hypothetical protein